MLATAREKGFDTDHPKLTTEVERKPQTNQHQQIRKPNNHYLGREPVESVNHEW